MPAKPWLCLLVLAALIQGCGRTPASRDHMQRGAEQMKAKEYARAILSFKSEIRRNPQAAEPRYQLGLAYLETKDIRSAVAQFREAARLDPKHVGARLKEAEILSYSRNPDLVADAGKRAREVLAIAPDTPEALTTLAMAELRLGQTDTALQRLEEALERFPSHLKSAELVAMIKSARRDLAGAEAALRKAAEAAPNSAPAAVALGRFYQLAGKGPEAEAQLRRALAIDPQHGLAQADLAVLLYRRGQMAEAQALFARLSDLPEDEYKTFYGRFLFREGKKEEALAQFDRLARASPGNRTLRTMLVSTLVGLNRLNEAEKALSDALRENPRNPEALLQRGEINLRRGKLGEAENDLHQVLRDRPDSAETHLVLARLRKAQGTPLTQRQELDIALRYRPDLLAARIELVQFLLASRQTTTAMQVLDQAPEKQKADPEWIGQRNWVLLASGDYAAAAKGVAEGLKIARSRDLLLQDALLQLRQKNYPAARKSAEEVLQSRPDDAGALEDLVLAYAGQKQLSAGLAELRRRAAQRPDLAPLQFALGRWLAKTGNAADARKAFQAAKAADPFFVPAVQALGELEQAAGNLGEARKIFLSLKESPQHRVFALLSLGRVEEQAGAPFTAIQHYRAVLEVAPNNIMALNNLAYLLADAANQPDEALQLAQRVKELQPNSSSIDDTLGWAYFRKGLHESAIRHLELAVRKSPTPKKMYHLAIVYFQAGQTTQGKKVLEAALKRDPNLPEARVARSLAEAASAAR